MFHGRSNPLDGRSLILDPFKLMNPNGMLKVPVHSPMHSYDQGLVDLEVRISFSVSILVDHLSKFLSPKFSDLKLHAFQFKTLTRIAIHTISALLRLPAVKRCSNQFASGIVETAAATGGVERAGSIRPSFGMPSVP